MWFYDSDDLESLRPVLSSLDAILLPKTESVDDVKLIDDFLTQAGDKNGRIKVLAAIESAASLLSLKEICESSARIDALIVRTQKRFSNKKKPKQNQKKKKRKNEKTPAPVT